MPNHYFQFKQFTVHQDLCAMKVTTDGCLFGAVVADNLKKWQNKFQHILDIGTGTGLLSLMIAQVTDAGIDAIEIEKDTAEQARLNVAASPFSKTINIIHADLNQFKTTDKYDLICSNPPFYEADLKSPKLNKNIAKHDNSLTFTQLLKSATAILSEEGIFAVLLPYHRTVYFTTEATQMGLHLVKNLSVKQSVSHDHFRSILFYSRKKTIMESREIIIKKVDGKYTEEFISLLKDYYLHL